MTHEELQKAYDEKCAEAERMRGAGRLAYFHLMNNPLIDDTVTLNLLRNMYEACTFAEAGKPLLDKLTAMRQACHYVQMVLDQDDSPSAATLEGIKQKVKEALNVTT